VAPAEHFGDHQAARRIDQQPHFLELIGKITLAEIKLNDHRTLAGSGTFIHGNFRGSWNRGPATRTGK
jgi:hypothetical protein